ncbi:MAG: hypothetical protein R2764_21115, partial [Bacteroidales bacterium]
TKTREELKDNVFANSQISLDSSNKPDSNIQTKCKFKKVHTLIDTTGVIIGNVYIFPISIDVFKSLYIIRTNDTLYKIDKNIFYNPKGVDIESFDDNCYEYKLALLESDYIVLNAVCRKTKSISDAICIEWNYDTRIMEVHKTP